jgi:hypothetical protein
MLSQAEIATIKAEIEKLREGLDVCIDRGIRFLIQAVIEQHEQKLESERDSQ